MQQKTSLLRKAKKTPQYKILNWGAYNKSLINRENLNIWIEEGLDKTWFSKKSHKRGHPYLYSDETIELFLTLKALFHLPLRQAQGLLESLIGKMQSSPLPVPSYSQVCRRAKKLKVSLRPMVKKDEAWRNDIEIVVPPRLNARLLMEIYANVLAIESPRDISIANVRKLGLKKWKRRTGYHRRSRIETAMGRCKQIIGDKLRACLLENQITEHRIACKILNTMASLGMPHTVHV